MGPALARHAFAGDSVAAGIGVRRRRRPRVRCGALNRDNTPCSDGEKARVSRQWNRHKTMSRQLRQWENQTRHNDITTALKRARGKDFKVTISQKGRSFVVIINPDTGDIRRQE
jgi:hypothetical protein